MSRSIKPTPVQLSIDLNYAFSCRRHPRHPATGSEPLELVLARPEALVALHQLAAQLGLTVSPPIQLELPLHESTKS